MDYKLTAQGILQFVGGEKNISHVEHCSTRLRLTLRDNGKVNEEKLKAVPGVMGVVMAAQCQVVIGNNVVEVYEEFMKLGHFDGAGAEGPKQKQKLGAVVLDFIVGVFQPLIPVIAGGGILRSVLLLLSAIGWLDTGSDVYIIFNNIAEACFYFLPLFVAVTTARKLKCNQLVAMAAVGFLLLPAVTNAIAEGVSLFGFTVQSIGYNAQVFPAILAVLFLAIIERAMNKISPKPIRIFFVPLVCLAVTVPVTLLLLGPLGFTFGEWFTTAILFLYDKLGWLAVGILAPVLPFMIAIGMHKALVPYAISSITTLGREFLYLPASLAHNIAEGGACFGVAIRTRDKDLRATAISAGISAMFGITEPALYGVTIQNKRALGAVMAGSFVGGISIGLFGVAAFAAVGPGVASITMFVDADNSMNFVYAIIGLVVSFLVSFVGSLFLWREPVDTTGAALPAGGDATVNLTSPLAGEVVPLEKVNDAVFSQKVLGEGVAINPSKGELYAPAAGVVENVFDAKHAIGVKLANGAEVLFHVGLDTLKLEGEHFDVKVQKGDSVKQGDLLLTFDLAAIKAAGYDTVVPVVVTNSGEYEVLVHGAGQVGTEDAIMEIIQKAV